MQAFAPQVFSIAWTSKSRLNGRSVPTMSASSDDVLVSGFGLEGLGLKRLRSIGFGGLDSQELAGTALGEFIFFFFAGGWGFRRQLSLRCCATAVHLDGLRGRVYQQRISEILPFQALQSCLDKLTHGIATRGGNV